MRSSCLSSIHTSFPPHHSFSLHIPLLSFLSHSFLFSLLLLSFLRTSLHLTHPLPSSLSPRFTWRSHRGTHTQRHLPYPRVPDHTPSPPRPVHPCPTPIRTRRRGKGSEESVWEEIRATDWLTYCSPAALWGERGRGGQAGMGGRRSSTCGVSSIAQSYSTDTCTVQPFNLSHFLSSCISSCHDFIFHPSHRTYVTCNAVLFDPSLIVRKPLSHLSLNRQIRSLVQ